MTSKICLFITLLFLGGISAGSDLKYKVTDIPKNLLKDAKAVVREHEMVFEISDLNSAVVRVHYAITILNKNGLEKSILKEGYNNFSSVKKIKTTLYDQNGKLIRTGLNTVVEDIAAFDGFSLYNDYRIKVYDPEYATVPFTVEYSFEVNYNGLLNYPDWILYDDFNISTERSEFTVITPIGFKFRYLEKNLKESCKINGVDKVNYIWSLSGLPAIRKELYSQSLSEFTPVVYTAPHDFEIGGYKGNCESWTNFGIWINQLGHQKNILKPETQEKIKSLVKGVESDYNKVSILYRFLQNKVRYVSIQQGLGGWQPIDAESVDKFSYGDCKALANYMKSLLEIIGIKSYYTLIGAGESAPPLVKEFPSNHFNHAIVCVPIENDTIWLECTDQQIPFGYLGSFTDNRKALIVDESGGKIVNTKVYSEKENTQFRAATIKLTNDGTAQTSVKTVYRGLKYEKIFRALRMDDKDKKKFIVDRISIPNTELLNFKYDEIKDLVPSIIEDLSFNTIDFATVSGDRMMIRPNLLSRIEEMPLRTLQRNSPVKIRRSYCEYDSLTYLLQGQYKSDLKPFDFRLVSPFGEYRSGYILKENRLTYIRSFKLTKGLFPVTEYESFITFCEKIQAEDSRQIILNKL
jgi:hypothetical protein